MIQTNTSSLNIVDFLVTQGDLFNDSVEVLEDDTDFDFTGYTAKMEVRKRVNGTVFLTLDSTDGSIVLTTGNVVFDVEAIDLQPSSYMYDLKITSAEGSQTLFSGAFNVRQRITQ